MAVTLRDGLYQARLVLGEQIANYWKDEDLIYHLNWAAQDMCSEAQNLETIFRTVYPQGKEEAALPTWVDKVLGVAVLAGQLFQLECIDDYSDVQCASRVGGIPQLFYTKIGADFMSPQGTPANQTADITPVPLLSAPNATDYTTVLGLWPIPSSSMETTVWCTRFHPWQLNPQSPIYVPARFAKGWWSYAVARGKEKESMLDEAQYYDGIYEKAKADMVSYFIMRKQVKTVPQYGGSAWPMLARGSSSIIFVDQNPSVLNM